MWWLTNWRIPQYHHRYVWILLWYYGSKTTRYANLCDVGYNAHKSIVRMTQGLPGPTRRDRSRLSPEIITCGGGRDTCVYVIRVILTRSRSCLHNHGIIFFLHPRYCGNPMAFILQNIYILGAASRTFYTLYSISSHVQVLFAAGLNHLSARFRQTY